MYGFNDTLKQYHLKRQWLSRRLDLFYALIGYRLEYGTRKEIFLPRGWERWLILKGKLSINSFQLLPKSFICLVM